MSSPMQKKYVLYFYPTRHTWHLAERGPGNEAMALQIIRKDSVS